MTPQERQLIDDLFDRLAKLESAKRDPEAMSAIMQGLRTAPNAVYALVQTTLVQDEALKRADMRIQELEAVADQGQQNQSGGFLDSMRDVIFGQNQPQGSSQGSSHGSVPNVRAPEMASNRPAWNTGQVLQQNQAARGRSRLWLGAIGEGELDDVVADIVGPAGDEPGESPPVIGEQRPRRFLEACEIAGHHGHEAIGGIPCRAGAIRIAIGAARFVHQLSQRHRCAAGLRAEPLPMARQQCHLARDNAELGASASPRLRWRRLIGFDVRRRGRLRQAGNDFAFGATKIEIDRVAGRVAEYDDRRRGGPAGSLHDRNGDLGERARRQALRAHEGREMGGRLVSH